MSTMIDYVKEYGNQTFYEMPFNEVDALVLSQFSYMKWDGVIPELMDGKAAIALSEIAEKMDESFVFSDERYAKNNKALFDAMVTSKRFQSLTCNYFTNIIDETVETQFCAVVCFFYETAPVVVFRGTDENIVGWKEDFNMAFSKPVAGQRLAALYLSQVAMRFEDPFLVCGHSKGGNLAVYSSIQANDELQGRIQKIYSFDGPGFRPEILNSDDYDKVSHKICKLIPRSSLVGMLLENHEDYEVIASYNHGMMQHDPFSWKVNEQEFKRVPKMDTARIVRSNAFNEWVLQLDDNQLLTFVETLFDVLKECDIKTTIELQDDFRKKASQIITTGMNLDEELKNEMIGISKGYFENIYEIFKNRINDIRKK